MEEKEKGERVRFILGIILIMVGMFVIKNFDLGSYIVGAGVIYAVRYITSYFLS